MLDDDECKLGEILELTQAMSQSTKRHFLAVYHMKKASEKDNSHKKGQCISKTKNALKCGSLSEIHEKNWPKSNALTSVTHAKFLCRIVSHKK